MKVVNVVDPVVDPGLSREDHDSSSVEGFTGVFFSLYTVSQPLESLYSVLG